MVAVVLVVCSPFDVHSRVASCLRWSKWPRVPQATHNDADVPFHMSTRCVDMEYWCVTRSNENETLPLENAR